MARMEEQPNIRPAAADEIGALQAIDRIARSRYAALPDLAFVAQAAPIVAERFATGSAIVAAIGDRPVGFVLCQPLDGLIYLANISVVPEAAGRGVGTLLLRASVETARRLHAPA